jgi:hypothetical protein
MFQQNHARSSSICPEETNAIRFHADGGFPDLSMYPLPVRDALHVAHEDLRSCIILDAAGRVTATVQAADGAVSLDLSALPRGVYFLLAQGNGLLLVRSFIKN